jgi:hypothetical protein
MNMVEFLQVWFLIVIALLYSVNMFVFVLLTIKSRIGFSDEEVAAYFTRLATYSKSVFSGHVA